MRVGAKSRVVLAVVLLPLLVAAVRLGLAGGWHPTLDNALIELRVRDVGSHPVLLGPFSREGWNHPGPALFYLLALPYRMAGGHPIGLLLGALAVNAAAIAGMAVIARRRGGQVPLLAMLLLLSLLVRTLGVDFLADPWNPNITVLPFGLFLFLCWDMTCGGAWSLPLAVGVGSFLVQSHLGYAPVTAVLGLFGTAWLIKDAARTRANRPTLRRQRRTFARATVAAAAVFIVVWTPPVMEQLIHRQGNLDKLTDYVSHPRDRHSLADSYKIAAFQLGVRPEWLTRPHSRDPFTGELLYSRPPPVPVLLVAFIAASAFALRRRYSTIARLAATVGLGLLVAVVSVSQIRGPVFSYLVRWTWVLGMATALVVVWAGLVLLSNRRTPWRRSPVPILTLGIVAVTAINVVAAARAAPPAARESRLLNTLAHNTLRELPRGHKPVLLHWSSSSFPTYAYGLAAELERHGIEVSVEPFAEMLFGAERVAAKPKAETVLFVATQSDIDRYDTRPSYKRIARASDLSQAEAAKVRARIADLSTRHDAGLLTNANYGLELAELSNIGTEVVVFAATG